MAKVQHYIAIVNLGGSTTQQLPLCVTPAEIRILRHLHGHDACVKGYRDRVVDLNVEDEWARLISKYGEDVCLEVLHEPAACLEPTCPGLEILQRPVVETAASVDEERDGHEEEKNVARLYAERMKSAIAEAIS